MVEVQKAKNMGFEDTELRLGLPGNNGAGSEGEMTRKRGFSDTVGLQLNLSSKEEGIDPEGKARSLPKEKSFLTADPAKPPAKAQVVGWPPVRSFRKNMLAVQKSSAEESEKAVGGGSAAFVKVSMDGAPYLRKVDLKIYMSYQELSHSLGKMLSSFASMSNSGSNGIMKEFINESKGVDLLNGTDYVPTYEDKDGDWMLVGDVPWEMFVGSCKRLRIMKAAEATGLAPRAMEKTKNRSYK